MNLSKLTEGVISIAKEVGNFIRNEAYNFDQDKVEYKGLHDMVSYVDKSAEIALVDSLRSLLPEAGFVTEEKTATISGKKYNWIIDPLDGTTNFIHGLPTYSISIALQCNDELILGVVYEINRDECFSAWKNGGAYLNNKKISVSKASGIEKSLVATGFPYYEFGKLEAYLAVLKDLMQRCHGVRRIGSAAIDLAYVACGRFDAYFEFNLNSYDVAAGIVLVREAGGQIFDFIGGNKSIERREMVATNGLISAELLLILDEKFNQHK